MPSAIAALSDARLSAKRYGDVGRPSVSAASRRMPSRFIVSWAARALGMTSATPARSMSTSTSVAIASISGTMICGRSCSMSFRSAPASVIVITCVRCATWWPGAFA